MHIMNIDDSGSSNTKDTSRYYILSGTIIEEIHYKQIKEKIFQYKLDNFKDDYIDAEIHVHELYKSQPPFSSLPKKEKYKLLDQLYEIINQAPISIISVVIDKPFFELFYPKWNLFNTAWSIIFQRFDSYLDSFDSKPKGKVRIDKSTKDQHKKIANLVETLQKELTEVHKINNVIGKPSFVSSESSELIQISDAVGYCTLKYHTNYDKFTKYWNLIKPRHFNKNGQIESYGLNIFPTENTFNLES